MCGRDNMPIFIISYNMDNIKIYKKDGNLIGEGNGKQLFSEPLIVNRYNSYEDCEGEEMSNICGMILGEEKGFAFFIDMSYCGKADQVSDFFFRYRDTKKNFLKLCKELDIIYIEYNK